MRRASIFLLIFVLLLVGPALFRYFTFYQLGAAPDRGEIPVYDPAVVVVPEATPPSTAFVDEPTMGKGQILLDVGHGNAFSLDELAYFHGRLAARGFEFAYYEGDNLAANLRAAAAFVVIAPLETFTAQEVTAVKTFVAQGGRLLIVGDPTRFNVEIVDSFFDLSYVIEDDQIPLNSLAAAFDLTFNGDYLYNQTENEGNFRNILIKGNGLGESPFTESVSELVFYGSHSIDMGSSATAVLRGDDNTWSSATDRPGGLTLAASSQDGRVLALGDLHFLTEPYYTSYDNGRFIAHIANFLTASDGRVYSLLDFPYFYDTAVNLNYVGLSQLSPFIFEQTVALQQGFRAAGYELNLTAVGTLEEDSLWVGLYNQADESLVELLASHDITFTIDPPILTNAEQNTLEAPEGTKAIATATAVAEQAQSDVRLIHTPLGDVPMSGTGLFLLNQANGRNQLIVLAASSDGLLKQIGFLLEMIPFNTSYEEAGCLVQNNLALCPTNITDEAVEAELIISESISNTSSIESEDEEEADGTDNEEVVEVDLDAISQGRINLGDSVEAELAAGESHMWILDEGTAVVDIVVEATEDVDAILELYDSDFNLVDLSDSSFSGGAESLLGIELDPGDYFIVVRDYYEDGGTYTLTVTETDESTSNTSGSIEHIFLFVDDTGEPLGEGINSADRFLELLSDQYEVTVWVSSIDGTFDSLDEAFLNDIDLLIWDTGDYIAESTENDILMYTYLLSGGKLLLTGSAPLMFVGADLTELVDIQLTGDDLFLLDGLESEQSFLLDDTYQVYEIDNLIVNEGQEDQVTPFLINGPESNGTGLLRGIAILDPALESQVIVLSLPFVALPEALQASLLSNMLSWFEATSY